MNFYAVWLVGVAGSLASSALGQHVAATHDLSGSTPLCEAVSEYGSDLAGAAAETESFIDLSADGLEGEWNGYTGMVMNPYPDITPDRRPVYAIGLGSAGGCGTSVYSQRPDWHDVGDDDGEYPAACTGGTLNSTNIQSTQAWWTGGSGAPEPDWDSMGNGVDDTLDWLLWRLDTAYAQGWRRFVLHKPAGVISENWVPSSFWWTLDETRRDGLIDDLGDWIDSHTDATVGVYGGFKQLWPCDLCMHDADSSAHASGDGYDCSDIDAAYGAPFAGTLTIPLTPASPDQYLMNMLKVNTEYWMMVGIQEFWFEKGFDTCDEDNIATCTVESEDIVNNPEPWFMRAQLSPDFTDFDVRLIAEPPMMDPYDATKHGSILDQEGNAIPSNDFYLDLDTLTLARGVGALQWFEKHGSADNDLDWRDGDRNLWDIDRDTTEQHVMMSVPQAEAGGGDLTRLEWLELFGGYAEGGFIPWIFSPRLAEYSAWVTPKDEHAFASGVLPSLADRYDFDRDGTVEIYVGATLVYDDDALILQQLITDVGNGDLIPNMKNGDINYDGDVDSSDLSSMLSSLLDDQPVDIAWTDTTTHLQ